MTRTSDLGQLTLLPVLADAADITAVGTTMADQVEKKLNMRFATEAARDAEITSPEEGMECYTLDLDRTWLYTTSWVLMSQTGSWTPTLTNVAIGTGGGALNTGSFAYNRGMLAVDIVVALGTAGASVTGTPGVTLPTGFTPSRLNANPAVGVDVSFLSGGAAALNFGVAFLSVTNRLDLFVFNSSGTYVSRTAITAAIPAVWAAGDAMFVQGTVKGTMV